MRLLSIRHLWIAAGIAATVEFGCSESKSEEVNTTGSAVDASMDSSRSSAAEPNGDITEPDGSLGDGGNENQPSSDYLARTSIDLGDPYFARQYVDIDEWRDEPVRHRYIHGGFEGTDARFSGVSHSIN